jgi:hypothetical protein
MLEPAVLTAATALEATLPGSCLLGIFPNDDARLRPCYLPVYECDGCGTHLVAFRELTSRRHADVTVGPIDCPGSFGPQLWARWLDPQERPGAPQGNGHSNGHRKPLRPAEAFHGPATGAERERAPRVLAALDLGGLHLPDGRRVGVSGLTAATIAPVAAELGVRDVYLTARTAEALGLEPAREWRDAKPSPFLEPAGGWAPARDRLTSMTVLHQSGARGAVRFHFVAPTSRLASLAVTDAGEPRRLDGPTVLRLMLRFEELTGTRWDGSASRTTAYLRRALVRDAGGMSPDAYDPREQLPPWLARGVTEPPGWFRPLPLELAERFPFVVRLDKTAAYLSVFSSDLPAKAPEHAGPRPLGELGRAGWAVVRAGPWPDPESFDPLTAMRRPRPGNLGRLLEQTTYPPDAFPADLHSLRYAASLGISIEVLDAWTFPGTRRFLSEPRGGVQAALKRALAGLEAPGLERDALRPLVKAMYSEFHGWLKSDYHDSGDVLWRPDWADAIEANLIAALHRLSLRAPGRVVAALGIDSLGVLMPEPDPTGEHAAALLGVTIGERLGQYKAERGWPSRLHVPEGAPADPAEATRMVRRQRARWFRAGGEA